MGGNTDDISAETIAELEKKVKRWLSEAKRTGLNDIRLGWDPKRVIKTEKGYQIKVSAHS